MESERYALYHNPYSICSIMVRQTIAICGEAKPSGQEILITEVPVDIFNQEQLSEHFLCEINAAGQVPVLISKSLDKPMPDSLEITFFLGDYYPSLFPASHKDEIVGLLRDLHDLNYFSLSFPGREHVAEGFKESVLKRLDGDISPRYRDALTYKLSVLERDKIGGLKPGVTENMSKRASKLMQELEGHLPSSEEWLFGLPQPSALDAHLAVFIARMLDVGRDHIIPAKLKAYFARVMQTAEWQSVMQGRKTMIAAKE